MCYWCFSLVLTACVIVAAPLQVHFAATKDSLSRHFNKFGEVLKVVIVTDAATGQPKGSVVFYVNFNMFSDLCLSS